MASHYHNQWYRTVNMTCGILRIKLIWNVDPNTFNQRKCIVEETLVCKMLVILCRPRCVDMRISLMPISGICIWLTDIVWWSTFRFRFLNGVGVQVCYRGEDFFLFFCLYSCLHSLSKFCLLLTSQMILLWKSFHTKYFVLPHSIDAVPTLCYSYFLLLNSQQ